MNVYMKDGRVLDWHIYITYDTKQITHAEYNYMERRWKEPQTVNKMQSLHIEKTDHSYETKLGGVLNILNTAVTIVMST